jgi:hypothetical protein
MRGDRKSEGEIATKTRRHEVAPRKMLFVIRYLLLESDITGACEWQTKIAFIA